MLLMSEKSTLTTPVKREVKEFFLVPKYRCPVLRQILAESTKHTYPTQILWGGVYLL